MAAWLSHDPNAVFRYSPCTRWLGKGASSAVSPPVRRDLVSNRRRSG